MKVAGSATMPPGVAITASAWMLHRLVERAPLVAAVGVGAVEVVDLADAAAGDPLDLAAQLDERQLERLGEQPAERRLAGAAQADQGDAPAARRVAAVGAEQLRRARAGRGAGRRRCVPRSSSRSISHSGELVVTSPTSSASVQSSAVATCCSTRIDALPTPYSRLARWRSETPDALGDRLARQAAARAQQAHALAEGEQEGVLGRGQPYMQYSA